MQVGETDKFSHIRDFYPAPGVGRIVTWCRRGWQLAAILRPSDGIGWNPSLTRLSCFCLGSGVQ